MSRRFFISLAIVAGASIAKAQPMAQAPTASWAIASASLKANDTIRVWSTTPSMYGRPLLVVRLIPDSVVVRSLPNRVDWWAGVAGSNISAIDVGYANTSRYRATAHGLIGAATGFVVGGAIGFLITGGEGPPAGTSIQDHIGGSRTVRKAVYAGAAGAAAGFVIGWSHGSRPFLSWSPLYRVRTAAR